MKYLLTLLPIYILSIVSCKKTNDAPPIVYEDPKVLSCSCHTFNNSPYTTSIYWAFKLNVPDSNSYYKLILREEKTLFPVFDIAGPVSKDYQYPLYFDKCPKKSDNAFYFFEWVMKNGTIKRENSFQVWE